MSAILHVGKVNDTPPPNPWVYRALGISLRTRYPLSGWCLETLLYFCSEVACLDWQSNSYLTCHYHRVMFTFCWHIFILELYDLVTSKTWSCPTIGKASSMHQSCGSCPSTTTLRWVWGLCIVGWLITACLGANSQLHLRQSGMPFAKSFAVPVSWPFVMYLTSL